MSSAAQRKHRSTPHSRTRGAQQGNRNARKHGGYAAEPATVTTAAVPDIDTVIQQLQAKQETIAAYIADLTGDGRRPNKAVMSAIALFRQNSSTLGRLLKTRKDLGAADSSITDAINHALDEVAKTIGVEL